jgi:N utilization substance protein A
LGIDGIIIYIGFLKLGSESVILNKLMPAIQRSEFALALNQVSNERGLDPAVVLETVQNAILAAYRKDHPESLIEEFTAELNANTGEAKIFHNGKDVTPPGFGRIAAQTAKQVILQKIREKEKEAVISDFRLKIGTIVSGMVLRFAGPNIIVDVGKTEAIMPPEEQIHNEKYHLNQRLIVYIVEIKDGLKGEEVVVSRANKGLLEGLFKREVPEVAQGAVEIKAIEREPGNRSKVAVFSNQSGIDPVGSCVGQKGVRVQAIIQEFSGLEKIDIIQWQENAKNYIAQALSPAKELKVDLDEKEKTARVSVAPEELSLAIGKEGQNVRLASKLTGYRIEIEGDETLSKAPVEAQTPVKAVPEDAEVRVEEPQKPKKEVKKAVKVKEEDLAKEASQVSDLAEKVGDEKAEDLGEEATEVAQSVEALKEEESEVSVVDIKAKDDSKEDDESTTSNG